jgi:hypothetical protein
VTDSVAALFSRENQLRSLHTTLALSVLMLTDGLKSGREVFTEDERRELASVRDQVEGLRGLIDRACHNEASQNGN